MHETPRLGEEDKAFCCFTKGLWAESKAPLTPRDWKAAIMQGMEIKEGCF